MLTISKAVQWRPTHFSSATANPNADRASMAQVTKTSRTEQMFTVTRLKLCGRLGSLLSLDLSHTYSYIPIRRPAVYMTLFGCDIYKRNIFKLTWKIEYFRSRQHKLMLILQFCWVCFIGFFSAFQALEIFVSAILSLI